MKPTNQQIVAAKQTLALLVSTGYKGKRLNSKAQVRFANKNGYGETFVFGDCAHLINIEGWDIVLKVSDEARKGFC